MQCVSRPYVTEPKSTLTFSRYTVGASSWPHVPSGGGAPNGIIVTDPASIMKKDSQLHSNGHIALPMEQPQHGYDNLAYTTTTSDLTLNGNIATISGGVGYVTADGRMKRSLSSASQLRLQRASSLYGGSLPTANNEQLAARLHALNPATAMHGPGGGSTRSEFDASSFSVSGIFSFPVRSQSELSLNFGGGSHSRHHSNKRHLRDAILGHKPRSLMYLDEDDYLARPPPSRPVSMGYVNANQREFSTQSLDRSRLLRKGAARRAASMEEVDVRESPPDVKLQKLAMQPFDYLNRPGSKPSDLDVDSDDVRGIRDVAL